MSAEQAVRAAASVEAKLEVIARELDRIHLRLRHSGRSGIQERGQQATGVRQLAADRHLESTDVRILFTYWCKTMSKRPNTRLTPERRRCIQGRLKAGYSVEFLKRAIDGCAGSDFHMNRGRDATGKRFNDLTLILRNDTKAEEFHDMAGQDPQEKKEAFL
jgi:hypothetical protein